MSHPWSIGLACLLSFAVACGSEEDDPGQDDPIDEPDPTPPEDIPSYAVTGTVVDFATGEPVVGQATVTTANLTPPPTVSTNGASFTIDGVPPHSVFHALAGAPPTYRNTYGAAIEVLDDDVADVELYAVSESYLIDLIEALDVNTSTGGILFARAVDEDGNGRAGISATAFELNQELPVDGPYFLDASLRPDPLLTETSASGYAIFFQVDPGLVSVNAAADSGYSMLASESPVAQATVTLSVVVVSDGPAELPSNVSFSADVVPIFERRGCVSCHSGNGIGKDLGNLMLDGGDNKVFREAAEEISPTHGIARIDLADPASSLLLTQPSAEDPADAHPNVTFVGPQDPDYQLILVWIQEGALLN